MALYVAGAPSANPAGRTKGSIRNPKRRLEAFYYGYFTTTELRKILNGLSPKDKADFYLAMTPYVIAKPSQDGISGAEVERLIEMLTEQAQQKKHG